MFSKLITATATLAALMGSTSALGINCRGSSTCGQYGSDLAGKLAGYINGIDQSRWYNDGEHIACSTSGGQFGVGSGAVCAFLQGTNGASGANLIPLAQDIVNHGCTTCGSVPIFIDQGDNNVNDGELSFNYVSSPSCGEGLC